VDDTRDRATLPSDIATCNGGSVWEDRLSAVHANSTASTSCIATNGYVAVDANQTGTPSSILSPQPLNPLTPSHYGQGNTQWNPIIENSQASAFSSDGNLFSGAQISQPSLPPIPGVGWEEHNGNPHEMRLQTQYPAADGFENPSNLHQTMNSVDVGISSSMPAAMNATLQDNWGVYNPQIFPGQMTYPQITFNTLPSTLGIPFQIYTPRRPRIYCTWPLCMESFARPGDLERHRQSVHLGIKHHCFWPGCHNNHGKGYVRCDKLRAHQKEKHGFA
jgi:hypothetical protein